MFKPWLQCMRVLVDFKPWVLKNCPKIFSWLHLLCCLPWWCFPLAGNLASKIPTSSSSLNGQHHAISIPSIHNGLAQQHILQSWNKVEGSEFVIANSQVANGSNKLSAIFAELRISNAMKLSSYRCSFLLTFHTSHNGWHSIIIWSLAINDDVSRFSNYLMGLFVHTQLTLFCLLSQTMHRW